MQKKGLVWIFSMISVAIFSSHCSLALISQDGLALLEIKSTLNDSRNILSDWQDSDESPCNWTGITCHPQDLRVSSINLPYMQLGGTISPSIGKLSRLQRLALHQNSLHGNIPNEITNCAELRALYLRANYLQGGIPSDIGNLSSLTILFVGNLDLCGQQVHKPCRTSLGFPAVLPKNAVMPSRRSSHYIKGVLIGAMSALGFAFFTLLTFLWVRFLSKKERVAKKYTEVKKQVNQEASTKLITFHGDMPYPSSEIIEKLESLDEEDVVGSGGFGTVYRMVMNDCGTFAVKRIDRSREGCDQVFERELEILGSIKHINLVNPCFKASHIYYLAMGSLDDFLHEHWVEERPLNWNARLKIALGSARGIAYLHHDCSPKIVHRDIKSSNILLNENLDPHVSDFGLAKLLVDEDAHITTVVAGTFGYLAPEYLQSGRATQKTDVYSFGVLLLELVTGKRPTDPTFVKRGLNVVGWMNTQLRENRLHEVVDKRCKDADAETVEAILEIAARCTDANPDDRPSMNQVLQLLEPEVMSPCPSDFYESHSDHY
ncbi:hypothetical protein C1H46_033048 [Malus baccata]|uniref:Protein kinase domain-containing protein n=1 Tax=Malus baccata TaxID=106549 RepID=A0A540L4L4_MALBA|nr:hypothetical protein C1H46_033048 [Malus baccata]